MSPSISRPVQQIGVWVEPLTYSHSEPYELKRDLPVQWRASVRYDDLLQAGLILVIADDKYAKELVDFLVNADYIVVKTDEFGD